MSPPFKYSLTITFNLVKSVGISFSMHLLGMKTKKVCVGCCSPRVKNGRGKVKLKKLIYSFFLFELILTICLLLIFKVKTMVRKYKEN